MNTDNALIVITKTVTILRIRAELLPRILAGRMALAIMNGSFLLQSTCPCLKFIKIPRFF